MGVTYRLPAPPLDAYIACLQCREGPAPSPRLAVLPRPTLHVMINLGDAFQVYEAGEQRADRTGPLASCGASWAAGVQDTPYVLDWPRELRLVSVYFKPGGAAPFLRLPLVELHNQLVSLDAIWGAAAAEVRERLAAQPTPQARLALLERLLLARLARLDNVRQRRDPRRDPWDATVRQAVAQIARTRGALSIHVLSAQLGVSHKHLITQFQRLVGATPKALERLYRLQHVLDRFDPGLDRALDLGLDVGVDTDADADPTPPRTWAQVAQQAGYYDESHFHRDFRAFTGQTPSAYLRVVRRVHAEHPDYGLAPLLLPTEGRSDGVK